MWFILFSIYMTCDSRHRSLKLSFNWQLQRLHCWIHNHYLVFIAFFLASYMHQYCNAVHPILHQHDGMEKMVFASWKQVKTVTLLKCHRQVYVKPLHIGEPTNLLLTMLCTLHIHCASSTPDPACTGLALYKEYGML